MDKIIEWKGMELVLRDFEHSHANGGRLNKLWVEDRKSGRIFLIKTCSKLNYEPFSEKMAYIIGKELGIDVLEYDIIPIELFKGLLKTSNPLCRYVSICERIDKKGYSITSIAEIKRARNVLLSDNEEKITNKQVMYELLPRNYIDTMLLFDAIIGNTDRHYGNIHLLRSIDGEMIGAPILDNGASLLANIPTSLIVLAGNRVGKWFNKSFTLYDNHDAQISEIKSLKNISFNIPVKTMNILEKLQPVLDEMPKYRAKIVKKYITYRLHKYLGIIKYDITETNQKDRISKNKDNELSQEYEHT